MLRIFQWLKVAGDFRRAHMPFVQTVEDFDLLREIGFYQARGHPMSLRILHTKGFASHASIQRRLKRLRRLGVVEQERSAHDKRVVHLTLGAPVLKIYARLERELKKIWN